MTTLITGLGNPGPDYSNTRHNAGFMVADKIAESLSLSFSFKKLANGFLVKGLSGGNEIVLLKPETFMNLSGNSVAKVMEMYSILPESLIVIQDDLDLPFGTIRTRLEGSSGGHNGLKSIEHMIQSKQFKRVKVGISNEHYAKLKALKLQDPIKDFVLSGFTKDEQKILSQVIDKAAEVALDFIINKTAQTFEVK